MLLRKEDYVNLGKEKEIIEKEAYRYAEGTDTQRLLNYIRTEYTQLTQVTERDLRLTIGNEDFDLIIASGLNRAVAEIEADDRLREGLTEVYVKLKVLSRVQQIIDSQVEGIIALKKKWQKENPEYARRLVSIGTAGNELGFVSWTHRRALHKAKRNGFKISSHAGEEMRDPNASFERIRYVIMTEDEGGYEADRIDHATILSTDRRAWERLSCLRIYGAAQEAGGCNQSTGKKPNSDNQMPG